MIEDNMDKDRRRVFPTSVSDCYDVALALKTLACEEERRIVV